MPYRLSGLASYGAHVGTRVVELDLSVSIWDHLYTVAPLVVIGTREADGSYDLAPKHMAGPVAWDNHFFFVCTPTHATYRNVVREGAFTVSYPRPDQVLLTSLAAAPRFEGGAKPALHELPTTPATEVEGVLLRDAHLQLECSLERVVDGFGVNSLVIGHVIAARADERGLRDLEREDKDVLSEAPLLAFLAPNRYAEISGGPAFPFHRGWKR